VVSALSGKIFKRHCIYESEHSVIFHTCPFQAFQSHPFDQNAHQFPAVPGYSPDTVSNPGLVCGDLTGFGQALLIYFLAL